ncbi:MAG TPA: DUF1810 domain-containing protein [Pseudorhizobium sp.]|nr:DUF1810 domain-containing protein [Pseudorhizobium sp.]
MNIGDDFNLERFVAAQEPVYRQVLLELSDGRKRSHWMWFIFPQLDGLGTSPAARHYAIRSLEEAQGYLLHPLLAPRLEQCTNMMLLHSGKSAHDILGSPDDLKFKSSMTLFQAATQKGSLFERALEVFYEGERDQRTLALLR